MYFNASKLIASLPSTLDPNTVYFVRSGEGFDLYCSDALGNIAHKVNTGDSGVVHKFTTTIGDNTNSIFTIPHNLNSLDVIVSVFYNETPYEDVIANIQRIDVNNVRLEFDSIIPLNKLKVVVVG